MATCVPDASRTGFRCRRGRSNAQAGKADSPSRFFPQVLKPPGAFTGNVKRARSRGWNVLMVRPIVCRAFVVTGLVCSWGVCVRTAWGHSVTDHLCWLHCSFRSVSGQWGLNKRRLCNCAYLSSESGSQLWVTWGVGGTATAGLMFFVWNESCAQALSHNSRVVSESLPLWKQSWPAIYMCQCHGTLRLYWIWRG